MKKLLVILAVIVTLTIQLMAADWSYYRRDGSRYYLTPCDSLITILFTQEDPGDEVMTSLQTGTALSDEYDPVEVGFSFWQFGVEPGSNLDTLIEDLLRNPGVRLVNPVFALTNGKLMYTSDEIILRAKASSTQQEMEDVFDSYNLAVEESPDSIAPFYLVALTADSPPTVFGISDSLFESDLCRYATPNFYGDMDEPLWSPNDTYYPQQWNLNHPDSLPGKAGADIDMELAWNYSAGDSGSVIAIIDYAFDIDHVDLGTSRMIAPYDAGGEYYYERQPDYDPRLPASDLKYNPAFWHGTACLGMFRSVTNNAAGIASPGGNFYFMPIKGYDDQGWRDDVTAEWSWAWAIYLDVEAISFSIGYGSNIEGVNDLFEEAWGRGIPILCAAGNWPDTATQKSVRYPASMPQAMAVGATDINDSVTYFSARGQELDIVAPGAGLYTLDVTGDNGYCRVAYNPCGIDMDYTCEFGGTSAAAPTVAGVAALVLSRMPSLKTMGVDSIYSVLRNSAEDQINAADPAGYDTTYGYGRLNAARAILSVVRGDVDNNGVVNISDATYLVSYVMSGGPAPVPTLGTGDVDCNGIVNISDAVYIIAYIFGGGQPPKICYRYNY